MVKLVRVMGNNKKDIDFINSLYDISFPIHEQRDVNARNALFHLEQYYLYKILDENKFVGFIGCWDIGEFFYIEHFAISQDVRGIGYGQKSMTEFCKNHKRVILEIDPVEDEISKKRLSFYEKNGFVKNNYTHYHPSYTNTRQPHKLIVLSSHSVLSESEYAIFNKFLSNIVMNEKYL